MGRGVMLPWGRFFHPVDSNGRESRTLWFVAVSWLFLTVRFLLGGMEIDLGIVRWIVPADLAIDYGAAVAAVLAVWLGREWVVRNKEGE